MNIPNGVGRGSKDAKEGVQELAQGTQLPGLSSHGRIDRRPSSRCRVVSSKCFYFQQ